eukprot:3938778-Rhodomonas_salina.1
MSGASIAAGADPLCFRVAMRERIMLCYHAMPSSYAILDTEPAYDALPGDILMCTVLDAELAYHPMP